MKNLKTLAVTHATIVYSAALGSILFIALALLVILLPTANIYNAKTPCPTNSTKAFTLYGMADNWLVTGNATHVDSHLVMDFPDLGEPKKLTVPADHQLTVVASPNLEGDLRHATSSSGNSAPGTTTYTISCSS